MRSYPVKENPIGSAVSQILRYKQTDRKTERQTDRHRSTLYYRKTNTRIAKFTKSESQTDRVTIHIRYPIIQSSKVYFCVKLKISTTYELIEFSFQGKVLGWFFGILSFSFKLVLWYFFFPSLLLRIQSPQMLGAPLLV